MNNFLMLLFPFWLQPTLNLPPLFPSQQRSLDTSDITTLPGLSVDLHQDGTLSTTSPWGNRSHTGCSFNTRKGAKTLVGKLRRGRLVFYGVFDGIYPRDTPLRLARERCSTAAERGLMLLWSALRSWTSVTRDQKRGPMNCQFSGRTER